MFKIFQPACSGLQHHVLLAGEPHGVPLIPLLLLLLALIFNFQYHDAGKETPNLTTNFQSILIKRKC